MATFEEYEKYYNKYTKIYGPKTAILYQLGDFYEIFGVDNGHEKIGNILELAERLRLNTNRRRPKIAENSRSNPLFAGFPLNQLDRYVEMLTEVHDYAVIIVEQVGENIDDSKIRAVTNIVTPSTNVTGLSRANGNYLMSIYIESDGTKTHQVRSVDMLSIGISSIDVSTGQSLVNYTWNLRDDENRALDDTYRLIQSLGPREIIISQSEQCNLSRSEILTYLDLNDHVVHWNTILHKSEIVNPIYQTEFLGKIFTNRGMLTPLEYLNLRIPTVIISYIILLEFCYKQNENNLRDLSPPRLLIGERKKYLIPDNNCLGQLNIIQRGSRGKLDCVLNLVNQTSTGMGRRYLSDMIIMPSTDQKTIESRYDYLEAFRTPIVLQDVRKLPAHKQNYLFQQYEPHLSQISDLERLHRKMCISLLQPAEFNSLDDSYNQVVKIIKLTQANEQLSKLIPDQLLNELREYMNYYRDIIDLDETPKYQLKNITGSFFKPGKFKNIDKLHADAVDCQTFFEQLTQKMSSYISKSGQSVVDYEHKEKIGYQIDITAIRYKTLIERWQQPMVIKTGSQTYKVKCTDLEPEYNRTKKKCKLSSKLIRQISNQWISVKKDILQLVYDEYIKFISDLYKKWHPLMKKITDLIGELDFYKSNAKTSLLYNYCRPKINSTGDGSNGGSFIKADQIRHPLIERFQEVCEYVPQDVDLSGESRGMLLYGVNCSGKSSLMKAIGVSIIMAQAGLYVPASSFMFYPYNTILTRIVGNDNLFKGLSSFAVEMSELRGIMKRNGDRTLVLGDEICHGTETISGVSIIATTIIELSRQNSNFVFATHLHQLSQMKRIVELDNVKMYHLKVKFDDKLGDLVYDRRLESGSGPPVYGLEVAKAMGLDRTFIELANTIRQEIMEIKPVVSNKKSRYNSRVFMDQCGIPNCSKPAVDTNHIKFQSFADKCGFIGHIHKDHKSNLIPLCKECHNRVHNENPGDWKYLLSGYKMTSNGPKLDLTKVQNHSPDFKKFKVNLLKRVDQKFEEISSSIN